MPADHALRLQAPQQAHQIRTSDDTAALAIAQGMADLSVLSVDGALHARGDQEHLDAYIAALVSGGVALRGLSLDETPLEALFFMLTEASPGAVPSTLSGAGDRENAGAHR